MLILWRICSVRQPLQRAAVYIWVIKKKKMKLIPLEYKKNKKNIWLNWLLNLLSKVTQIYQLVKWVTNTYFKSDVYKKSIQVFLTRNFLWPHHTSAGDHKVQVAYKHINP